MKSVLLPMLGAIVGYYLSAADRSTLGLIAGGLIGWLFHAVSWQISSARDAQKQQRKIALLQHRVDDLEQRRQLVEPPSASTEEPFVDEPAAEEPTAEIAPPLSPTSNPEFVAESAPTSPKVEVPLPAELSKPTPPASPPLVAPSRGRSPEDMLERAFSRIKRWFTTGNIPVKVGVVVSFFGVAFLLKYAADRELFNLPIEYRLASVALGAVALLVIGWRLRTRMRTYALSMQGGGLGILYLTIFATLRTYELIPAGLAFALLVLLTVFTGVLAVRQNARGLAILGTMGGFLAPILVSTDSGDHVALFSYYFVLNGAVFGIAFFRAWRELNLLGFAFTYVIAWIWGFDNYRPELLASTLPFVILFFFLFLGISVLYAYRRAYRLKDYLDTTIVFGTPVMTFAMIGGLLADSEYALATSAITMGAIYLLTATVLHRWTSARHRMLVESFLALGIAFATIAFPLAFDARWTSGYWALEGAALIWIGARQRRLLARASGALLQIAAGVSFLAQDLGRAVDPLPLLNSDFLGTAFISLAALFGSFYLYHNRERLSKFDGYASHSLLGWAVVWWFGGGLTEILSQVETPYEMSVSIVFCAASMVLGVLLSARLRWPGIAWPALGLVPLLGLLLVMVLIDRSHPFDHGGWIAWPLALVPSYWVLQRLEDAYPRWIARLHAPSLWLLATIGAAEIGWQVWQLSASWLWVDVAVIAFLGGLSLVVISGPAVWPLLRHRSIYLTVGVGPLVVATLAGVIIDNLRSSGDPAPLPYLPLLNPLDLTGAFIALVLGMWLTKLRDLDPGLRDPRILGRALAALTFFLSTAMVIRTVHHWGDVPFRADALFRSVVVQASVSLFWGLLALTAMIIGARRIRRDIWLAGAALMGIVVAKLFLIDLGNSGTLARIVSFIGVGLLLLVVGYFAGVPPRLAKVAEPGSDRS